MTIGLIVTRSLYRGHRTIVSYIVRVRQPKWLPDLVAVLFMAVFFGAWLWPALAQHQVLWAEDLVEYFYPSRAALYNLFHQGGWSWWDPVPGLGMPRLDCIEAGYLSPVSLLF